MSPRTNRIKFLLLFLALVCCCQSANAQGLTGQISGILTDPAGGVVPNAKIEVINEETARVVTASSDSDGNFVVPQLLSGTYTLVVTADGFKRFEQKGIILTANDRVAVRRIALEVGDFNQTVTITAETVLVKTNSSERAGLIDEEQIQNIALKGRDYMGLVRLLPGVVDTANREAPGWNNLVGVTVNGSRSGTLNLTLDGVSSLDTGSQLGPYLAPGLDAIGEVKVLLTNYQAEYGRSSGGTINVVIKNGTRDFHGGGFYFKRHEQFNANEFFNNLRNQPKPRYRFNYWGGNIGGPVIIPGTGFNKNRDKLFFFWSQEYLPRLYPTRQGTITYPTALERAGDFSQSLDTSGRLIVVRDPQTGQPFPGNIIPANRIDPNGQKLLSIFPLPNINPATVAYNYNNVFQSQVDQPRREEILRMDWNISPKTTFYARGIQNYEAFKGDFNFVLASNVWPQFPIKYQIESRGLVSTLIHSFSPTLTNEFTFGINRALQTVNPLNQEGIDRNDRVKLGLSLPQFFPVANPLRLVPNATFGGITNATQLNIEQRFPFFGTNNIWNYSDNISWVKGNHNLKAGFYFEYTTRNAARAAAFNGTFNFDRNVNNPLDTNHPFANALIGTVNAYTESNNKLDGHARYRNVEWFAQDNWKVTRRFTVDAGIRFYYIEPTYSEGDSMVYFDPSFYDPSKQPALMTPHCLTANPCSGANRVARNPITGATAPAVKIGTFADTTGTPFQGMRTVQERVFNSPPIQLGPRIGFAYDLFGDGKTSVRGGIGVFYDRFNDDQVLQQVEQPPNLITSTANFTTIKDLLATPLSINPPGVNAVNPEFDPTATYNFSLGIQRDIGFNTVLDVAYVGSLARHLLQRLSLNAVRYGARFQPSNIDQTVSGGTTPLPDNFLRPIKGYADIQLIETGGNSNYHSMQVQLNRRFSSSLSFGVSYTWSKAMTLVDGNNNAINPFIDREVRNYGRAGFDRTHTFVVNYVYRVPSLSRYWDNAVSRTIFSGWELSGITSFISGAPSGIGYALVSGRDLVGGGGAGVDSRVLLVANPMLARDQREKICAHAFAATNTAAQTTAVGGCHLNANSVLPPTATGDFGRGNGAKDLFRLPGMNNWDISLFKNFNLAREGKVQMQYRLEMYNASNHTQFTGVDTTARFDANNNQVNALFGSYTNAANARRIVMGLKVTF
ncbi:MAG: carboxypeptidase-like regulatory domain-containing protein [Acidobacteria bacterium]|nr:carboxypeptidase-like regulatory domain-containing protein [Acidobacteriota bacterium]